MSVFRTTTLALLACAACGIDAPDPEASPGGGGGGKADDDLPTRRIDVEVDHVGYQRFVPGTMNLLTHYFDSIGYELHIEESDVLDPVDVLPYGNGNSVLAGYYRDHFEHRGQAGWHYMLMADTIENGNRGWGAIGGDMFEISSDPVDAYPDHAAEAQANIILHELGHNLGLLHEGFEPEISAGTHSEATCATADRAPAPDVPVVFFSPNCVEHIRLDARPYVTP